ncbi:hypothetical protein RNI52_34465 [Labrys neptuniae]|uniref:hypothetical protein n=1 Tax=Labrys neptuniae TaxID=376174 RepID=UPI002891F8BA|nr:hypothetical protein [Labrys neptuniae]MDT3382481.1 hypothetical protein [Labrys neptuniae]
MSEESNVEAPLPEGTSSAKFSRAALNVISGAIPFAGGLLSAAASAWSEREQDAINRMLQKWIEMLREEMREKEITITEIIARIDMQDEKVAQRVASPEYQSLLKKSFREWAGSDSEEKRKMIRNLLANAASAELSNDDVVRLFIEWIHDYSDLHFSIISNIYNRSGITRRGVWEAIGRGKVREDSADADLFRLLFRDLSTGGLVRQHREKDGAGNFYARQAPKAQKSTFPVPRTMKSAFDDGEQYELTELGQQFVHYALTDLPPKLNYAHAATGAE